MRTFSCGYMVLGVLASLFLCVCLHVCGYLVLLMCWWLSFCLWKLDSLWGIALSYFFLLLLFFSAYRVSRLRVVSHTFTLTLLVLVVSQRRFNFFSWLLSFSGLSFHCRRLFVFCFPVWCSLIWFSAIYLIVIYFFIYLFLFTVDILLALFLSLVFLFLFYFDFYLSVFMLIPLFCCQFNYY